MTHDYTNEVELKSLVIRERNSSLNIGTTNANKIINELNEQYKLSKDPELKQRILELSSGTRIDKESHEKFGEIILLMIKKILTKPNFSGYSWVDEFYSTSCYRVLKYLHNFDYTKKSERTGQEVSAFSYITQIIMMSILETINRNNKLTKDLEGYTEKLSRGFDIYKESKNQSKIEDGKPECIEHFIDYEFKTLPAVIREVIREHKDKEIRIYYPEGYKITYDEYSEISEELKKSKHPVSLIRL